MCDCVFCATLFGPNVKAISLDTGVLPNYYRPHYVLDSDGKLVKPLRLEEME